MSIFDQLEKADETRSSSEVKPEPQNQGTKEPRKEGTKEDVEPTIIIPRKEVDNKPTELPFNLPMFDVSKERLEEREVTRTIPTNSEIYPDQEEAIKNLRFILSKNGRKTKSKKQLIIDAIDDMLVREYKKLIK